MKHDSKPKNDSASKGEAATFDVPAQGSLGLLALGAVGIKAWREKRNQVNQEQQNKKSDE